MEWCSPCAERAGTQTTVNNAGKEVYIHLISNSDRLKIPFYAGQISDLYKSKVFQLWTCFQTLEDPHPDIPVVSKCHYYRPRTVRSGLVHQAAYSCPSNKKKICAMFIAALRHYIPAMKRLMCWLCIF